MVGKLPMDYLVSIIDENIPNFQKEVAIKIIENLDVSYLPELQEIIEARLK